MCSPSAWGCIHYSHRKCYFLRNFWNSIVSRLSVSCRIDAWNYRYEYIKTLLYIRSLNFQLSIVNGRRENLQQEHTHIQNTIPFVPFWSVSALSWKKFFHFPQCRIKFSVLAWTVARPTHILNNIAFLGISFEYYHVSPVSIWFNINWRIYNIHRQHNL